MVLRLEHFADHGAEGLIGLDDVRSGGIFFAGDFECGRRFQHGEAVLEQRVDELRRGREIRLIGGHDVAARVAEIRIVQDFFIELRWHRGFAASASGGIAARAAAAPPRPLAARGQSSRRLRATRRCASA